MWPNAAPGLSRAGDAPAAVRYPRGQGPGADPGADLDAIERNHEAFANTGEVIVSARVRRLLKAH